MAAVTARRRPPELLPCPCGSERLPVKGLNGRRHSFAKALRCSVCGLTSRESPYDFERALNWNGMVRALKPSAARP
jgi:hypothetical protein